MTEKIEKTYLALHNGISKDNLPSAVFTGHAGTGKTHLSRALGYAACQKGLSVLFITAAEMVNHLQHAQKTYNLEAELNKYRKPQVLIIDELGYVALDTQASNLFFQVLAKANKEAFPAWRELSPPGKETLCYALPHFGADPLPRRELVTGKINRVFGLI